MCLDVFFLSQFGYNSFLDVIYPSLETNVTGIMPPDVQWTHQLFSPDGTVNGVGRIFFAFALTSLFLL
jgi:hypothetical protein